MKETLNHLKKNWQFRKACKKGQKQFSRYAVIFYVKNGLPNSRFGFSVSKKVGNSVVRHRVKRLFKESLRRMQATIPAGYDVVIIAKRNASHMSYQQCQEDMFEFLEKMNRKISKNKRGSRNEKGGFRYY